MRLDRRTYLAALASVLATSCSSKTPVEAQSRVGVAARIMQLAVTRDSEGLGSLFLPKAGIADALKALGKSPPPGFESAYEAKRFSMISTAISLLGGKDAMSAELTDIGTVEFSENEKAELRGSAGSTVGESGDVLISVGGTRVLIRLARYVDKFYFTDVRPYH